MFSAVRLPRLTNCSLLITVIQRDQCYLNQAEKSTRVRAEHLEKGCFRLNKKALYNILCYTALRRCPVKTS